MTVRTRATLVLLAVLIGLAVLGKHFGWVTTAPHCSRRESSNEAVGGLPGRSLGFANRIFTRMRV